MKPRRIDAATRLSLALLSRLCDWRSCLMVVRPETVVRWHRAGWRRLWRYKSRPGRPPIPLELRQLIRRMATDNPPWGEERIANKLLLKLAIRDSPRTVSKYMPKRPPPGRPRGDQRWSTFVRNHAKAIVACDFFVTPTATFRLLYVFVVIVHGARPHMALGPGVPDPPAGAVLRANEKSRHHLGARALVCARSVLGGLHHQYSLAPALA